MCVNYNVDTDVTGSGLVPGSKNVCDTEVLFVGAGAQPAEVGALRRVHGGPGLTSCYLAFRLRENVGLFLWESSTESPRM